MKRCVLVLVGAVLAITSVVLYAFHRNAEETARGDHPQMTFTIEQGTFETPYFPRPVEWRIALPANGVKPVATIYSLHGMGGNAATTFDDVRLHTAVAQANLPFAIASLDGGTSYWHDHANGIDTQKVLIEKLVPLVDNRTGTSNRVLFGISMGGYGSLLAALEYPEKFQAVAAISAALWKDGADSSPGAFDNAEDYNAHDLFPHRKSLQNLPIYLDCGTEDPFIEGNRAFASELPSAKTSFRPGMHDMKYFRSATPHAIQFFAETLGISPTSTMK